MSYTYSELFLYYFEGYRFIGEMNNTHKWKARVGHQYGNRSTNSVSLIVDSSQEAISH